MPLIVPCKMYATLLRQKGGAFAVSGAGKAEKRRVTAKVILNNLYCSRLQG